MVQEPSLCVKVIPLCTWEPLVAEAFERLKGNVQQQHLAYSILTTLHNRHVGVTPRLAAELVPLLTRWDAHLIAQGAWKIVFERLAFELVGMTAEESELLLQHWHYGVLLSKTPLYSVMRLAMPLVAQACWVIGRCYLFCADNDVPPISRREYKDYDEKLYSQIVALAQPPKQNRRERTKSPEDDPLQLFWQEQALTLSTLSQPGALDTDKKSGLAEADPAALGFMLHLEPVVPHSERPSRSRPLPTPTKHQKNPRYKQAGIEGIHITQRIEDMSRMLSTEWINPDLIFLDRLLNTGYLALERPPKPEKLRDALIVAFMPSVVRKRLSGDFAQASWFHWLVYLSQLLRDHKLSQSEFRWIEGDQFERARSCGFLLQNLTQTPSVLSPDTLAVYRHEFLKALRWLPDFLDTRDCFDLPGDSITSDTTRFDERLLLYLQWADRVWRRQTDHHLWAAPHRMPPSPPPADHSLQVDTFAFVHVMLFLPAEMHKLSQTEDTSLLGWLSQRLLGNAPSRHVSVTWVPDQVSNAAGWGFAARGRPSAGIFRAAAPRVSPSTEQTAASTTQANPTKGQMVAGAPLSEARIAGGLVRVWLDQIVKEMWHA